MTQVIQHHPATKAKLGHGLGVRQDMMGEAGANAGIVQIAPDDVLGDVDEASVDRTGLLQVVDHNSQDRERCIALRHSNAHVDLCGFRLGFIGHVVRSFASVAGLDSQLDPAPGVKERPARLVTTHDGPALLNGMSFPNMEAALAELRRREAERRAA